MSHVRLPPQGTDIWNFGSQQSPLDFLNFAQWMFLPLAHEQQRRIFWTLWGQYSLKQGFEANHIRKFTRKFGKIFATPYHPWFLFLQLVCLRPPKNLEKVGRMCPQKFCHVSGLHGLRLFSRCTQKPQMGVRLLSLENLWDLVKSWLFDTTLAMRTSHRNPWMKWSLGGRFRFFFCCSGAGEREEACEQVREVRFVLKVGMVLFMIYLVLAYDLPLALYDLPGFWFMIYLLKKTLLSAERSVFCIFGVLGRFWFMIYQVLAYDLPTPSVLQNEGLSVTFYDLPGFGSWYIYIYICIYIYAVESKLGPKIAFFESKLGPNFLSFFFFGFFFQKRSSFCRENEIFKEKRAK